MIKTLAVAAVLTVGLVGYGQAAVGEAREELLPLGCLKPQAGGVVGIADPGQLGAGVSERLL